MLKPIFTVKPEGLDVSSLSMKHLAACLELDELALGGLWTSAQWQKELNDTERLCLGIFNDSKLIALACGWLIVDELHISAIAVHPKHRRCGLAHMILTKLLENAQIRGSKRATLEVQSSNTAAKALYKHCGFITKGSRTNYYKDGSDALILWRNLGF